TREQDIQHDRYRPYYVDRLSASLDARGMPLAWRHTIAGAGLWALYYGEETVRNGVDFDAVTAAADLAYPLQNVEVRFVRRDPAGVPTGWWRGVGPTRSVFAVESFMDELAAAAQQDPVRYRRALLKDPRMRAVLDLAADRAGWGTALPAGSGRGVSLRISAAPRVEVHLVANGESPGGVGETGTSCIAAALCNAIYAASGKRVRTLPVSRGLHA